MLLVLNTLIKGYLVSECKKKLEKITRNTQRHGPDTQPGPIRNIENGPEQAPYDTGLRKVEAISGLVGIIEDAG